MESDTGDSINDVLFMRNLGVSVENIALLKRMSLEDVNTIINDKKNNLLKENC